MSSAVSTPPGQDILADDQASNWKNEDGEQVQKRFLQVLGSRRADKGNLPAVPLSVREASRSSRGPILQREHSDRYVPPGEVLAEDRHARETTDEEHLVLTTEAGPQGQVPMIIVRPKAKSERSLEAAPRRATVIFLHSTGRSKEMMLPFMRRYASKGYIAVAIDSRYHGERADGPEAYSSALVRAWREGREMPFLYDTAFDLIKVIDYLSARRDVDPARIGMTGVSLGGMHTWMAALADPRVAVAVPLIGVQSFHWAVEHNRWHARVGSIPHAFEAARKDMGRQQLDSNVISAVWKRLCPGLLEEFDAPHSLCALAPRPLLVLNGEIDPRCPIAGLEVAIARAKEAYTKAGVPGRFQFVVEKGLGHETCANMERVSEAWFDRYLKPEVLSSGVASRH